MFLFLLNSLFGHFLLGSRHHFRPRKIPQRAARTQWLRCLKPTTRCKHFPLKTNEYLLTINGWKMNFPLKRSPFFGKSKFREGIFWGLLRDPLFQFHLHTPCACQTLKGDHNWNQKSALFWVVNSHEIQPLRCQTSSVSSKVMWSRSESIVVNVAMKGRNHLKSWMLKKMEIISMDPSVNSGLVKVVNTY